MPEQEHSHEINLHRLKRMKQALWVNAGIFAVEMAAGLSQGSNGLLAEATHESGDTLSHALDVYGEQNPRRSRRLRQAAGSLICIVGTGIGIKSGIDLVQGSEVPQWPAAAIAVGGAAGNIYITKRLHDIEDHSNHSQGQLAHAQGDAIKSSLIAAAVTTGIIADQAWIDSAAGVAGGVITVAANAQPTIDAFRPENE